MFVVRLQGLSRRARGSAQYAAPTTMQSLRTPNQSPPGRNTVTQAILGRRSIREAYADRPVPRELVEEVIRCGLAAPSSKNARPWRFHVVDDRMLLGELAHAATTAEGADTYVPRDPRTGVIRTDWPSSVAESAATLAAVPTAIFVENLGEFSFGRATLASVPSERLIGSLVGYTFEAMGIGAAVISMWLAANSLGIQASFMGDICVAEEEIKSKLGFQHDFVGVLGLGYSDLAVPPDRVSYDVDDSTRVVWHQP